jgi:cell division protein YceG involved in septum cleavage
MTAENQQSIQESEIQATKRRHVIAGLAMAGLALVTGKEVLNASEPPQMEGEQTVTIVPGDTVSDIVNYNVENGASNTGKVVDYVVNANPDVFQDGTPDLGSEDLGKDIVIPKSVEK